MKIIAQCLGTVWGKGGRGGGRNSQPPGKAAWVSVHWVIGPHRDCSTKAFPSLTAAWINADSIEMARLSTESEWQGKPGVHSHIWVPIPQHCCLFASSFLYKAEGRLEQTRSWQPSWPRGHKENEYLSLAQWKPPEGAFYPSRRP